MSRARRPLAPACSSGKASHPTQGEARRVLLRIRQDQAQAVAPTEHAPTETYRCPECGWWHLTKRPQS